VKETVSLKPAVEHAPQVMALILFQVRLLLLEKAPARVVYHARKMRMVTSFALRRIIRQLIFSPSF
jgi:hypothetical protein